MPTKGEIAEAVERKRKMQSKMIMLPNDSCKEDAARLEAAAQEEFPLHAIIALNPISSKEGGKKYLWGRVLDEGETYRVV
jgi:hypothetical protein